jgi:protease I
VTKSLAGRRIAFLFTDGVEQVELSEPLAAVRKAGADATPVSLETGEVQLFNNLEKGETIEAGQATADADPSDFDGLVLPGGVANPDRLRADAAAVAFVRGFFEQHKPVAPMPSIERIHAAWSLAS